MATSGARAIANAIRGTLVGAKPIEVGHFATLERVFDMESVLSFANLTGDDNPLHVDEEFAKSTPFGRPIVHGMMFASTIPTIFGATVVGSVYVSQNFKFLRPVFVGEAVEARIEVLKKTERTRGDFLTCSTTVSSEGKVCMDGEAVVLVPRS